MTDNGDISAKVAVRARALEWLGGPAEVRVLDCFAGFGVMRDRCYAGVRGYLGIENRNVRMPRVLCGDNMLLAPGRADLFDLFDLDAYGDPWTLATAVCAARSSPDPFALVLTCGVRRRLSSGRSSRIIEMTLGLPRDYKAASLYHWYDTFSSIAIGRLGVEVVRCVRAPRRGAVSNVWYWAILAVKR